MPQIDDSKILEMITCKEKSNDMDQMCMKFGDSESVTRALKKGTDMVIDAESIFDAFFEEGSRVDLENRKEAIRIFQNACFVLNHVLKLSCTKSHLKRIELSQHKEGIFLIHCSQFLLILSMVETVATYLLQRGLQNASYNVEKEN